MRIGEFSQRSGFSQHTIRYYEKIGLLPRPARDATGRRDYDLDILAWSDFLARLKSTGMPLAKMRQYAKWREIGNSTLNERQRLLLEHKAEVQNRIAELQSNLALLDTKIDQYGEMINEHVSEK